MDYLEQEFEDNETTFALLRDELLVSMRIVLNDEGEFLATEATAHLDSRLPVTTLNDDIEKLDRYERHYRRFYNLDIQPRYQTTQDQNN